MPLRNQLEAIGLASYDPRGTRDQPVFLALSTFADELSRRVPAHYLTPVSRGVGNLPLGLWVSILDPEVTRTPTRGTYLAYLFNARCTTVSLSLNQGVTAATVQARAAGTSALDLLRAQADAIRVSLERQDWEDLEPVIDLGSSNLLRKYSAGNALARTWHLGNLPPEQELSAYLDRFVDLYAECVAAREDLLKAGLGGALPPARDPGAIPSSRERRFEPKDASEYRAIIHAHEQTKSRSHEELVARLGAWAILRSFEPNTNVHPEDLVLHGGDGDLLVEVKVFTAGRPRRAIRECIGQLLEYKAFIGPADAKLVAALSANPGGAYLELLSSLGIVTVWPNGMMWEGTDLARSIGLID